MGGADINLFVILAKDYIKIRPKLLKHYGPISKHLILNEERIKSLEWYFTKDQKLRMFSSWDQSELFKLPIRKFLEESPTAKPYWPAKDSDFHDEIYDFFRENTLYHADDSIRSDFLSYDTILPTIDYFGKPWEGRVRAAKLWQIEKFFTYIELVQKAHKLYGEESIQKIYRGMDEATEALKEAFKILRRTEKNLAEEAYLVVEEL